MVLRSAGPFQRISAGYADVAVVRGMTFHDSAAKIVENEFASRCLDDQNCMAFSHSCAHHGNAKGRGWDACTDQPLALGHDVIVAVARLDIDRPDVALFARRLDLAIDGVVDPADRSFDLRRIGHHLGL